MYLSPTQTDGYNKPTPWGRESFEVPWPGSGPKAIVIELGMDIFLELNNLLKKLFFHFQAPMINSLTSRSSASPPR